MKVNLLLACLLTSVAATANAQDNRILGCWKSGSISLMKSDGRMVDHPDSGKMECGRVYTADKIEELCTSKIGGKGSRATYRYTTSGSDRSLLAANPYTEQLTTLDGVGKKSQPQAGVYTYNPSMGLGTFGTMFEQRDGSTKSVGYLRLNEPSCNILKDAIAATPAGAPTALAGGGGTPFPRDRTASACKSNLQSATYQNGGYKVVDRIDFGSPIPARDLHVPIKGAGSTPVYPVKFSFTRESGQKGWSSFMVYADPFGELICLGG